MNQGHPQQELPRDPDDEAYGGYPEYEEESEWPEPLGPSFFEEYGIDYQHIPVRLPQDTHRPHFTLPNNNFTSRSFSTHSPPISRHDSPNLPSFESLTDLDLASFAGTGERPRSPTPFPGLENSPQFPRQSRRRSRPSSTSISLSSSLTPRSTSTTAFVDLTSNTPIMPQPHRATKRSALQASTSTHNSSKKRKTAVKSEIDEIDLLDVDSDTDLARVLEKQRVNTVKAQQEEADKPTKLANLTCVVCMEEMTNMTATHCGHLFCHTCLMEALIAGENQASEPGKGPSKCPICRKKVKRPKDWKDTSHVIPLEIKFKIRPGGGKGKSKA